MDRENIPSSKQNESQVSNPSNGRPSGNGVSDETFAKKNAKTRRRRKRNFWKEVRLAIKGIRTEVWVAMIGAIATIITTIVVTLPTILPLVPWMLPSPTSASLFTSTATTVLITDTLTATQTLTHTPTFISSPTLTDLPAASITPSVTIEASPTTRMFVKLTANRNTGSPPLHVRFDARDSYLLELNGTRLACRGGPCFYTWNVYSGGQQIGNAENNSIGTFEHTFGSNGTYTVTVFVCRGRNRIDCAGSGTQIVVSR